MLKRAVVGLGRTRPHMAEDCPERLSSLPEFVGYIWTTRKSGAAKIERLAEHAPAGCQVVRLRSDEEVAEFVAGFSVEKP